jgi:hypothetical protein
VGEDERQPVDGFLDGMVQDMDLDEAQEEVTNHDVVLRY